MDYVEKAYDDAKYGRPSENPLIECTMATALDNTLAPPGKHILSMFVQYAPYHLKGTTWEVEADKFADRCFDVLNEYAPNFKSSVIARLLETSGLPLRLSVSATTRSRRGREEDGKDYHFWTRDRFEQALREGAFLEHAGVYGNYYVKSVTHNIKRGEYKQSFTLSRGGVGSSVSSVSV